MTEMGLQCYFHNMNTGTTAEPTLPTASFSFHIKKSDDQSITLSHCQGFLSHNIFSPYYGVLSREFLNSSLLETSECQIAIPLTITYCFLFSLSINLFVYVQQFKKKRFHLLQIKTGLLALSHQSHTSETSSWWKPSCWRILMFSWRNTSIYNC